MLEDPKQSGSKLDCTQKALSPPPASSPLDKEKLNASQNLGSELRTETVEFHELIKSILQSMEKDKKAASIAELGELVTHLDGTHQLLGAFVSEPEERKMIWYRLIAALGDHFYRGYNSWSPLARAIYKDPAIETISREPKVAWEYRRTFFHLIVKFAPDGLEFKDLEAHTNRYFMFLVPDQNSHSWAQSFFRQYLEEFGEQHLRGISPRAAKLVDSYLKEQERYHQESEFLHLDVPFPPNGLNLELAERLLVCNKACQRSGLALSRGLVSHAYCRDAANILALNSARGDSVRIDFYGERNRPAAQKAAELIASGGQGELSLSDKLETEIVQKHNLCQAIDGRELARAAAQSLDTIGVFIAYVSKAGRIYARGGPRVAEHSEAITREFAQHYDGVRCGGVETIGYNKIEVPFEAGEMKANPPFFRGSYSTHESHGHFLRIDAPINKNNYCAAKGISPEGYADAVLADYALLLRAFQRAPLEHFRDGWRAGTLFGKAPLQNIVGSPLLVINDDLRILLQEKGFHFPASVTLDETVDLFDTTSTSPKARLSQDTTLIEPDSNSPAGMDEVSSEVTVAVREGIHGRLTTKITSVASSYPKADVSITYRGKTALASSPVELILLGASRGAKVVVKAKGENNAEALKAVCSVLETA